MMTSDRVVVLDVRTQEEYDEKHIVNARLLTLDTVTYNFLRTLTAG